MDLEEQDRVLENTKKNMLVSASAGSGKTYVMIKYICQLICDAKTRVPVKDLLVLTFTRSAANQMKQKLLAKLKEQPQDEYIIEQIDALSTANISTIHSFCEKYLKKYANLLNLNENFTLLDENMSQNVKEKAFEAAFEKFDGSNECDFVLEVLKHNKMKLKSIIFKIENLFVAVADKDEFLKQNLNNSEDNFEKASKFLFENFEKTVKKFLSDVASFHFEDLNQQVESKLQALQGATNLFELFDAAKNLETIKLPPKSEIGEENQNKLKSLRTKFSAKITKLTSLKLDDKAKVDAEKSAFLEKAILKLYQLFESEQESIKKNLNCLGFDDLEKYMTVLSQQENLFQGFQYVFIDEYQDTNKIQEKIIKNIAKNCNFVAVGDAKQGIYGFRLASAEIFLKDLKDFQADSNSAVNFLQSNFRSDQKVLDFVNDVFKVCMTEDLTQIDYFGTSMLEGRTTFADDGNKAVNIDLVCCPPQKELPIPEFYDVKEAEIVKNEKNSALLCDILERLREALSSQISVDGVLRQVKFSDIAILSRKRDDLFDELENFLAENGVPVLSNSRQNLAEEPQIQILINFLRCALVLDDDVAVLSVLTSGLYSMDMVDILKEKGEQTLCDAVESGTNEKFAMFRADLSDFRFEMQVFGIKKALERLFAKREYRSFINLKPNGTKLGVFVDKFLQECEKFNFDLPSLVKYFESVEISASAEVSESEDNVLLTTIHDSKGLEYPIVFLINCDDSISKTFEKVDIEIDEKFGFAVKIYDQDSNSEVPSVRMRAIKESRKEKEFVEEMMIFYVALTRAKNRLYLFGAFDKSFFEKVSVRDCDTYFDFIFFALPNVKEALEKDGAFENERLKVSIVDEGVSGEIFEPQNLENEEIFPEIAEKIEKYLDFSYDIDKNSNFRLKESVTALSAKNLENPLEKFANGNFSFADNFVETGNAYHLALKLLDFEKVDDKKSLHQQLADLGGAVDVGLIDENVLFENVVILKKLLAGAKVFKEKEFVLKEKLSNLVSTNVDDKILVQGIVDLFAIKDGKIILVDYKFSNHEDEAYIINRYKTQLKLYKIALEEAFGLEVEETYLLSLKFAKLVKVQV